MLTVAASDVLAESPLMKVSDALTDIAEVSVNATLNLAYQTVAKRHGYPKDVEGKRCSLDYKALLSLVMARWVALNWAMVRT